MAAPVYLLIEGMHLRADSIARDAAFHYEFLRRRGVEAQIFCDRFDATNYPGIDARPFEDLRPALKREPGLVIYHWVDGWGRADALVRTVECPVAIRWHNNTPPWFFAPYSPIPTRKTVRGFLELLRLAAARPNAEIWANSEFSRRQLEALGIDCDRTKVVYPASSFLENPPTLQPAREPGEELRLLFVGRVVPHKGHFHLIAAARAAADMGRRRVRVVLPGRHDADMESYVPQIRAFARRLSIPIDTPGEITHEALEHEYQQADVFVALSEHEGFGLPVLEAMARGVPVVGYRCSAVTETLEGHPLAVDTLDPVTVGRRILAGASPGSRDALAAWQIRSLLPRFTSDRIERQLSSALANIQTGGIAEGEGKPISSEPVPPEVQTSIDECSALPEPDVAIPRDLPRDINPHLVTRYDLDAYEVLLRLDKRGSLRDRALELRFASHRGRSGTIVSWMKAAILRAQDGLVRTLELSHTGLSGDIRSLRNDLDRLAHEVAEVVDRLDRK